MRRHRSFKGVRKIVVPEQSINIRAVLDRISQGQPINAQLRQHTPLPPDGLDPEDFDTGTEEVLDLVDAQAVAERVEKAQEEQRKAQEKARKEKADKELQAAVEAELAKRFAQDAQE